MLLCATIFVGRIRTSTSPGTLVAAAELLPWSAPHSAARLRWRRRADRVVHWATPTALHLYGTASNGTAIASRPGCGHALCSGRPLNAAIWLNWLTGAPVKRCLIAYDDACL
jgi:hypothetical protein